MSSVWSQLVAPSEGRGATLDLGERGTLLMLPCSVMKRGANAGPWRKGDFTDVNMFCDEERGQHRTLEEGRLY